MIPMKCLKAVTYAGRHLKPGDRFECRGESDARVLTAIKKAERYTAPVPAPALPEPAPRQRFTSTVTLPRDNKRVPAIEPAVDKIVAPAGDASATETPKSPRQYHRRDMVAKE